jgi:hypothetical protein
VDTTRLLIITTVPASHLDALLDALARAGAGIVGHYTHCSFSSAGTGRFKPSAAANPHIGEKSEINTVDEIRVETFCNRAQGRAVLEAIRAAHPYETPVVYVLPLLDEASLENSD